MSIAQTPQFQLRHRLGLALEAAGVTPEEMAAELGVHVNSVYNYMSGRTHPKLAMVKLWAMRTGVPYVWIIDGDDADDGVEQGRAPSGWTSSELFTRPHYFLDIAS